MQRNEEIGRRSRLSSGFDFIDRLSGPPLPTPPMHPRHLPLLCLILLLGVPAAAQEAASPLRAGPMLGAVTHRTAAVWLQVADSAEVRLRVRPTGRAEGATTPAPPAEAFETAPIRTGPARDHIARFDLTGLMPGTVYAYEVVVDGAPVAFPYPTGFETQPLWQWRGDPPAFTVAFGSCHYVNDPTFDRPGDGYGGGYGIFESIREVGPDLMLWLGDNTYLREVDWWSEAGMRYRYSHTRSLPEMQPLLAAQPNLATWDDHDYGPNNADRSFVLKGTALEVFQDYWANPSYGLPDVPGVFGHFQWADVDFFLLDDRYHRSPEDAPRTPQKTILGEEQFRWFVDALTGSYAPFKVVVLGGQVLNRYDFYEAYAKYPQERQRLLDAIAARHIDGVVFLSGDRHHSELLRLERDGGLYPLYDFTSSPLTAGASPASRELENELRVPGTLVTSQRSFGTLSFSGPRTDRTLTMRAHATDGSVLWEHTVRADDLRVARDE